MTTWQPPQTPPPADGPLVDSFGRIADDLRDLGHRPVQLPLHLLHAGGGARVAPEERDPDVRGIDPAARHLRRARRPVAQGDRRRAHRPRGPADARPDVPRGRPASSTSPSRRTACSCSTGSPAPLAEAGVDRATVSCDSLMRHRFAEMTRRDALDKVLAGLKAAEAAGLTPIKINTVVIGGTNDDEVVEFARWARETGLRGAVHRVHAARRRTRMGAREGRAVGADPRDDRRARSRSSPIGTRDRAGDVATGSPTARPGRIGVIASVTEPFCDTCNRLRLTAEGQLRACLFALEETDLRGPHARRRLRRRARSA